MKSHQRQDPVIRDAENADLTIRLFHVLYQPIDRVIGIRRMVDTGWILPALQRPVRGARHASQAVLSGAARDVIG